MSGLLTILLLAVIAYVGWRAFAAPRRGASNTIRDEQHPAATPAITVSFSGPSSRNGRQEEDDRDAWEGGFLSEASDPRPASAYLQIRYEDANGSRTDRRIRVWEFDYGAPNTGLMIAHCELRKATRTFRFSRVHQCIDMETGEVIPDVHQFLQKRYDDSPAASMEQFGKEYAGPLEILIFIARADGRLVAKERAVLLEFCRNYLPDTRVTDQDLERAIKGIESMSLQSFKVAVGKLIKSDPMLAKEIVVTAERLVAAEKTVHPAEREAVDYLQNRLSREVPSTKEQQTKATEGTP